MIPGRQPHGGIARERRLALLQLLSAAPLQGAAGLATLLGVSPATISRDLDALTRSGLIGHLSPLSLGASRRRVYYRKHGRAIGTPSGANDRVLRMLPRLPYYLELEQLGVQLHDLWLCWRLGEGPAVGVAQEWGDAGVEWRWFRDPRLAMRYHGRTTYSSLDALLVASWAVGPAQAEFHMVGVYLDDGLSDSRLLLRRLQKLYRFRYELEIAADEFPPLLVITASRRRSRVWRQVIRSLACRLAVEPLGGLICTRADSAHSRVWPLVQDGLPVPSASSNPSEEQVYDLGSGEPLLPDSRSDHHWSEVPGWSADTQMALCTRLWGEPCRRWVVDVIGEALQLQTPVPGAYSRKAGTDDSPSGQTAAASRRSLRNVKITAMTSATTWLSHTGLEDPKSLGAIFLQLRRQHLMLLCLIAYHSLSTPEDLATIAGLGLWRLERLLARLRKMKLIVQLTLPIPARGLPTARWEPDRQAVVDAHSQTLKALCVSPLGSRLLGAMYRLPSAHLPFAWSRWEKQLVHDVGIRRLLGLILQQASEVSRLTSEPDGGGGTRGLSVAVTWWTNAPDVALRLIIAGETATIFPDAAGEISWCRWTQRPPALIAAAGRLRFWVEWDQGSMNARDLWDKLLMYQRYAAFCSAAGHDGPDEQYGWQAPDTPTGETSGLPVLLFVTQDERQEQRVLRILAGLSSRRITDSGEPSGRLNVRLSTVDRLSQKGPLGGCWQTSSLAY